MALGQEDTALLKGYGFWEAGLPFAAALCVQRLTQLNTQQQQIAFLSEHVGLLSQLGPVI